MLNDVSYFRRTIVRQILIFLFFICGISISVSIFVWLRMFKIALGDNIVVTSAIFITFLCGIAMGSFYFGQKIDRNKNELQSFMWFQLVIGLYNLLLLFIFPLLIPLHKFIFLHITGHTLFMNIFKFIISYTLLIIPSTLIGATFPILSRFFIQKSKKVSYDVGNLYGSNFLGAAFGCFVTGFFFLQILGVKQTLLFASILSIFNFIVVRFVLNKIKATIQLETEFYNQRLKHLEPITTAQSKFLIRVVIIGFGISGFLTLSYLVLWIRSLIYTTGKDTHAFHIIFAVFLAGISLGTLLYPRILRERKNLFPIFAIIEIIIGFLGIVSVILLHLLFPINETLSFLVRSSNSWNWQIIVNFTNAFLVIILPTILVGATIPLVSQIYLNNFEERGKKFGSILTVKTLGALFGFVVTAFLLLPNVGTQKSLIFLALINFLLGLLILFLSSLKYGRIPKTYLIVGSVASLFLCTLFIPSDMIINLFEKAVSDHKLVYVKEGINATVTVHQDITKNHLVLASNGVNVTATTIDWSTIQRIYGHLPLLLHSKPESILTFGFRNGETLKSIFLHPIEQVDCVDNSSEIIHTSSLIKLNRFPSNLNAKFQLINMDGKNYSMLTDKKYDVIINDIVHPGFYENGRLLSREHFDSCRKNLKPHGMMSIAIPLFKISIEDFKILLHTFQSVFPYSTLWYPNNYLTKYAILIGSVDPDFKINYSQISHRLNAPGIIANLASIRMENIYEILDCFVFGTKTIKELGEGVRVNSDNFPYLEFSAPKTTDSPLTWNQTLQLLGSYRESVFPYLTNIDSTFQGREFVRLIIDNYYQSTELVYYALSLELFGEPEKALQVYRQVSVVNRFDQGAKRFFDTYYDSLLVESPQTPAEFTENATVYYQKMEYKEAIDLLSKALELNPDYAPAYFAMGINYEVLGELKTAKEMYQKTLKLKPNLQQAKQRLDSLSIKLKRK